MTDFLLGKEEEELFEQSILDAPSGLIPIRIDKYLSGHIASVSRNRIQEAIRLGWVLVNSAPVKSNYKVRPNDHIVMHSPSLPDQEEVVPQKMDLDIVFEDEAFIVVNKPAGMVVHPGLGNHLGTLLNGIAYYLREQLGNEELLTINRFGLVHRIDKETSGILVVAKSSATSSHLGKQFFDHTVDREYIGLVWGEVEDDSGTVNAHIGRHQHHRKKFAVYTDGEHGKHAITHYKVIERFGFTTLMSFKLETGRTHQIRVHMEHIGHPIFMDKFYGGDEIKKGIVFSKYKQFVDNAFSLCPRHALHAKSLAFTHPLLGARVAFDSPLPKDMASLIEKWRSYSTTLRLE